MRKIQISANVITQFCSGLTEHSWEWALKTLPLLGTSPKELGKQGLSLHACKKKCRERF
jgi:hypothetical protein